MKNNYYDLAEEDLLEAEDRLKVGKYNKCAYWCQQAGEKYLKYVLVNKLGITDDAAVSDHNLKRIHDRINRDGKILTIPLAAMFALANYYTKARYPGEGFVEVDSDTASELLEHAKTVKTVVDNYLASFPLEDELKSLSSKFPPKGSDSTSLDSNKK
jgi:HEPN domain-containing protein